jgi:hypothetical protein
MDDIMKLCANITIIMRTPIVIISSWLWINSFAQLSVDPTVKSVFDSTEIADLNNILTYFEDQICNIAPSSSNSLHDCYNRYSQYVQDAFEFDSAELYINYQNQLDVINSINRETFSQIWIYLKIKTPNKVTKELEPNDTIKLMDIIPYSKYSNFINIVSKTYPIISEYYNTLIECGGLCPTMISLFFLNPDELNIKDIRIRLIIAIHYITLNNHIMELR